jgi:hypothetical protein
MNNKKDLIDNLDKFKTPQITIDGVKIIGLKIIHTDDISDEIFSNTARTIDSLSVRSDSLMKSYSNGGIDYNAPVGIVCQRGDGKYNRIDSFARSDVFMRLGWDYMVYCVVECKNKAAERNLKVWSNHSKPKTDNSQNDLVVNAVEAIQLKELENNETDVRNWLRMVEPYRDSFFIDKCLATILKKAKSHKPTETTQTYTDQSIHTKWIKKHWANPPAYGFIKTKYGINPDGNCYQVTLPMGYESRKLLTALSHFTKTGKKTEFILHIAKGVSDLQTLNKQRNTMRKNIKEFTKILDTFYGKKVNWKQCFEVIGFVPQHIDEDIKQIIPF